MADNTFTDDITDAAPAEDAKPDETAYQGEPGETYEGSASHTSDSYAGEGEEEDEGEDWDTEYFEWMDSDLVEAKVFHPYTPPLQNEYIPLVIVKSELKDNTTSSFYKKGDFPHQVFVEAEHLSRLYGDKPFPYSAYLSKTDDRNPKKVRTPMGTAFLATGVIVKDGSTAPKKRKLSEMVEEMVGKEFISRVYFQDRQAKTSVEVEAYWGLYGAICNGDNEILKESDKKSTEFGKVLYFNPLSNVEKVTGDVFCDADGDPIKSNLYFDEQSETWLEGDEELEVTFGVNHPMLSEEMGFGKPGTRILDGDGDKVTVYQRTTKTYEKISDEFHPMPERLIVVDGRQLIAAYETVVKLLPPVKPNTKVIAYDPETGEDFLVKYNFDSTWSLVDLPEGATFHAINHGDVQIDLPSMQAEPGTAGPEDASFTG